MSVSKEERARAMKVLYSMKDQLIKSIGAMGIDYPAMSTVMNLAAIQKCIETIEDYQPGN